MEDKLVTIAKFDDNFEADLAQRLLADNGIQACEKCYLLLYDAGVFRKSGSGTASKQ